MYIDISDKLFPIRFQWRLEIESTRFRIHTDISYISNRYRHIDTVCYNPPDIDISYRLRGDDIDKINDMIRYISLSYRFITISYRIASFMAVREYDNILMVIDRWTGYKQTHPNKQSHQAKKKRFPSSCIHA